VNIGTIESVAVASALLPVLVVSHILLFRWRGGESPMYFHLLPAALLHTAAWFLGMLLIRGSAIDAAQVIAGLSLTVFCALAYAQVFSLTIRGFSLRILVDIDEHDSLTMEQIMASYSEGRGMDWMFERRLSGLESVGMIRRGNTTIALTGPGLWLGLTGVWTKRFLKMGPGG